MRGKKNPLRAQAEAQQSQKNKLEKGIHIIGMNSEFKILLVQEAVEEFNEFNFKYMNKLSVFGPAGGTRHEPSLKAFIILAFLSRSTSEHFKKLLKFFSTKYPVNLEKMAMLSWH